MSDLAARLRLVVEANHGSVISDHGNIWRVEVPADVAPGLAGVLAGFRAQFVGQTTRDAPRRVTNWQTGEVIVCHGDNVTTAYLAYEVDLAPLV
ncbi:MAG: hypothetical protein WA418_30570 [Bradyrhizobium sp.]